MKKRKRKRGREEENVIALGAGRRDVEKKRMRG